MVSAIAANPMRLLLIGLVAIATGFAIGSWSRGDAGGWSAPSYPEILSADEMEAAMTEVLLEPDTLRRALALDALLERLDAQNVAGAEAAIDPVMTGVNDCDLEAYFHTRTAFDPEGAFEHALTWPSVHKRGLGVYATAFSWALRGGALGARSFVESLESAETHKSGFTGLLQGWARSDDLQGVTQFLMNLPDDPNQTRNDVYITYVTSALLAYGGPDRLIAWVEAIPEDAPNGFKRGAFRNSLLQMGSTAPERAVAFHDAHADREYSANSLWLIAVAWQQLDPEAAFDWLLSRPDGAARSAAFVRAMTRWYSRDKIAAARWVAEADLDGDPELRKRLFGITRQVRLLRQRESGA